jgi:carotenoid cleavage dioxygenase-like enzyme
MSRDDVLWFDTGIPGAVVHPLNAWEEERAEDGSTIIKLWTPLCDNLIVDFETDDINVFHMVEYEFNLQTGKTTMTVVDDTINIEFSVIPQMGQFTRYGYTAIQDPTTPGEGSFSGFCTWDMVERTHRAVYYPENEVGGEPMVVQDDEDDGTTYVGTYLYNMVTEETFFVLYNGETTELVCRLKMPYRVPFGFHGQWLSGQELHNHFEHHGAPIAEERSVVV